MVEPSVNVFFYGSYINFKVLSEVAIGERDFQVCKVDGYKLTISPLANLRPKADGTAYGIVTKLTHRELRRLYEEHARGRLGGEYLPEAVIAVGPDGKPIPALCYISHNMKAEKADPAYVNRILYPAKEYGFPAGYLRHIEAFK